MNATSIAGQLAAALGPEAAVLAASLLPVVEPRYALLLGVALGLSPREAALLALAGVAVLTAALTGLVGLADRLLTAAARRGGPVGFIGRAYLRVRESAARRASGGYERLGLLGLAVFVAVPLPATGMYTGALAALALGVRGARLAAALAAGGAASVALVYLGVEAAA